MDTLKAIGLLSDAIGFMTHENRRYTSPGVADTIKGLGEVREEIRRMHESDALLTMEDRIEGIIDEYGSDPSVCISKIRAFFTGSPFP